MSDIWIVELYRRCTMEIDGYIGAKWEQYCDAEWSHPRWATDAARNIVRLNGWINPHNIRISKVEWNEEGSCWRLLDWELLNPNLFAEVRNPPRTNWKTEGF